MFFICMLFILLSNATTTRRDLALTFNRCLTSVLLIGLFINLCSTNILVLKEGVSLFGGLFHNTSLTITFHAFILFICIIIVQLTSFYPRSYQQDLPNSSSNLIKSLVNNFQLSDKSKEQYEIIEYPLIILFIIMGAILLTSSSDIISIFLSIELQSYGLYLLCALYRNSESSTGAGLTYFLLGGLSSCFILFAFAILYANSGATSLEGYYLLSNLSDINHVANNLVYWYNNDYLNYALIILSVGFLFKISAAPFHFWSPDVYDAIPTVVTTFVANIAKISILIFLIQIVHYTSGLVASNLNWTQVLLVSSLLSLIIGTVLGLNQSRIKRLLAYSTISHLGFILLAMSINSIESMQAFLFYLMQYSISNVNAFIIIITIGYTMYIYNDKQKNEKLIDENNSPIQYIAQLKGYYYINPLLAISFTIVMYSFVGIPPLIGFFGKQMVLSSALDKGYIFISLVAILTSVISAVYYLNIVKEIFFSKSDRKLANWNNNNTNLIVNTHYNTRLSTDLPVIISVLSLLILLFMMNPEQWLSMTNILAIVTFN